VDGGPPAETRAFEYRHRVLFEDTSAAGDVYFTRYLSWQGRCRETFLLEGAPGVIERLRDGLALVTTHCSCELIAGTFVGDEVVVRMRLAGRAGNLIDLDFEYWRVVVGEERLVARGGQRIACMHRGADGMVPEPVPDPLARALDAYQTAS
jgi:enediyne core biosynthesis thioesterase